MFKKKAIPAMAALCLFAGTQAHAGPNDYIRLPTVEYGEREIDFKSCVQKNRDGTTEAAHCLASLLLAGADFRGGFNLI